MFRLALSLGQTALGIITVKIYRETRPELRRQVVIPSPNNEVMVRRDGQQICVRDTELRKCKVKQLLSVRTRF